MKNIKIIGAMVIVAISLTFLSCEKKPMPRTIKGTIIDSTTNEAIKNTEFVFITTTDPSVFNKYYKRKSYVFKTDNQGAFQASLKAKEGDYVTFAFLNPRQVPVDQFIYEYLLVDTLVLKINKNDNYNVTIKTKKP